MYDLFCSDCGTSFKAKRPDKRYCGKPCAARAGRRRRLEQSDVTKDGRDCLGCGKHFGITPPSTNARYCSTECATQASRIQRRAFHRRNPGVQKIYNARRPYTDTRLARLKRKYPDLPSACESCGESRIVEIAHKPTHKRNGAGRLMSNSVRHMIWVLCPTCHKLLDCEICTAAALGLK